MRYLKKAIPLCLLALALVVCITLVAPKSQAATSGTCGDNLTWTLDNDGTLIISGTGAMYDWNDYSDYSPWYNSSSVKSVIIKSGVTTIGNYAFYECFNLQSITIPDGVISVGSKAFFDCRELICVTLPDSVTSIGMQAFWECISLTSIEIPDSITSIAWGAFGGTSLTYNIYENARYLPSKNNPHFMLSGSVSDATTLSIHPETRIIEDGAFGSCESLVSITIPDGVIYIGGMAFLLCDNLETVYYAGSQNQWNAMTICDANQNLTDATIYYNHIHDYMIIPPVTVQPTCTEAGYTDYTCAYLETCTYREYVPALGHIKSSNGIVIAPTCEGQGGVQYPCTRCGDIAETEYTEALGHDYTGPEKTIAPSCTEPGYTGASCIRCDSVRQDHVVAALGHNVVVIQLKDSTCTEEGITKMGTMCDRCQSVFIQPTYTPALGHDYVNGVCGRCQGSDSDYAPETIIGDITGDDSVNNEDVVYLLWHTLFPEDYPLVIAGDITGDGSVNNEDVVYLLWHTLFPEDYPL